MKPAVSNDRRRIRPGDLVRVRCYPEMEDVVLLFADCDQETGALREGGVGLAASVVDRCTLDAEIAKDAAGEPVWDVFVVCSEGAGWTYAENLERVKRR